MTRRLNRQDSVDDIFDQMQNMFNQFQNIGQEFNISTGVPVDITEKDGKVVVTADLPGVQKEDINLKADQDGVEITAESSEEMREENEKYLRRERSSRSYRRKVSWPADIDPDSIKAEYSDGVLTITAEKEDSENWDVEVE
ncbi:MAG: Hsp20/alpha crystallin family protein, partial [Candidatus Nanohaloarchaea archaeon]